MQKRVRRSRPNCKRKRKGAKGAKMRAAAARSAAARGETDEIAGFDGLMPLESAHRRPPIDAGDEHFADRNRDAIHLPRRIVGIRDHVQQPVNAQALAKSDAGLHAAIEDDMIAPHADDTNAGRHARSRCVICVVG
jgi:hypothetical protein